MIPFYPNGTLMSGITDTFLIEAAPDSEPPEISNVDAQPDPQIVGGAVNITCVVVDDNAVNEVWVNITDPDGDSINETMNVGSYYYNETYTVLGTYDYFIWANDTNDNYDMSTGHSFIINDGAGTFFVDNVSSPPMDRHASDMDVDDNGSIDVHLDEKMFDDSTEIEITVNTDINQVTDIEATPKTREEPVDITAKEINTVNDCVSDKSNTLRTKREDS